MPVSTVNKLLRKRLSLCVQGADSARAETGAQATATQFCLFTRLNLPAETPHCLTNVLFSDEVSFHVSETVNRHNIRKWGPLLPHSLEVNVRCGVMCNKTIESSLFAAKTVTGSSCLHSCILCPPEAVTPAAKCPCST